LPSCASIQSGLSRSGFDAEIASITSEDRKRFDGSGFDAVVLDLTNPEKQGLQSLHDRKAEIEGVPILLLTDVDDVEERVRWLDAGIDACLVKPFDLEELAARLHALVRSCKNARSGGSPAKPWMISDRRAALSIAAFVSLVFLGTARSEEPRLSLSSEQRQAIGEVVKEYLLQNPEVLRDAENELEKRVEQQQKSDQAQALEKYRDQLVSPRGSTIIGNPHGSKTLVAFFDYNCPYCRASVGDIQKLVDNNPELRVVLREFPILGQDSTDTSRLALALAGDTPDVDLRARYYTALMKAKGSMTGALALSTATVMGIDGAKLKHDLTNPEIDKILKENFTAAQALGVNGTPAFVIGDQVIVGAVGVDRMQAALSAASR
jgi:protein-disulfide isomerase/CheY-like chemotaxis protein